MKNQTLNLKTTITITLLAGAFALTAKAADHFDAFDTDHSGSISFTEYSKSHYKAKYNGYSSNCPQGLCDVGFGKHLWKQFAAMDSNHNGAVTRAEFHGSSSVPSSAKGSAPKYQSKGSSPSAAPAPKSSAPKSSAPKTTAPAPKSSVPKAPSAPAPSSSAPKGSTPN